MSTQLSQEDQNFLDGFVQGLKQAAVTGTEVSMQSLSNYVSSLSPNSVSQLSRMFKVYGYAGVLIAAKDSFEQGSSDPFLKYALGTLGYMIAVGTGCISGPAILIALGIGALVEGSWYLGEWIAENQDELKAEFKKILIAVGINIGEEGNIEVCLKTITEQCPMPKEEIICRLQDATKTAEAQASPLVLDLDGDGVETTSAANGVYFDHDGNGFSEKTGWAGKDDGLLVRDINGNGQIDDGTELFGDNTILSNGQKAANGFEALKDLDSNNDGVFNSSDTAWNQVKVWKDGNGNGIVDEGELLTLEEANIEISNDDEILYYKNVI